MNKFIHPDQPYPFVSWRRRGYLMTLVLFVVFLGGTLAGGGLQPGLDFLGGTSVLVKFDRAVDPAMLNELRELLAPKGLSENIRTIGGPGTSAEEQKEVAIDVRGTTWADEMTTRLDDARRQRALAVEDLDALFAGTLEPQTLRDLKSYFLPPAADSTAAPLLNLKEATRGEIAEIFQRLFNENIALSIRGVLAQKYGPAEEGREFDINNVGNAENLAAALAELKRRQAEAAIAKLLEENAAGRPWKTVDEFLRAAQLEAFDGPAVRRELWHETPAVTAGILPGVSVLAGTPAELSEAFVASFTERFRRNATIVTQYRDREFGGLFPSAEAAAAKAPADDPEMQTLLRTRFGAGRFIIASSETVGAAVGKDLMWAAFYAILVSMLGIVAYVWFRFELRYGVGAIVSLLHDTILTVGLIGFMQYELTIPIVAAVLTVMGYSINDTIVVYDRIREKVGKVKGALDPHIIDQAVTETLSRTIITGGSTIFSILAFYFLGPAVTRELSFTLAFGIIIGTFSSIFVAAPILVEWERLAARKR